MKRPITSPWSAVLISSPTITLIPFACSRASSAPEISLWSVTAIAPLEQQPRVAVSEHLFVLRQPRRHRHGAPRNRPEQQLRRRRAAGRGGNQYFSSADVLRLGPRDRVREVDAVPDRARQRDGE